jgi:Na+-transporting NADH:ubiquinone oxidoreductase subunit C
VRQSNSYIIGFSVILTIVCGGLLAGVYKGLKPTIDQAKADDKRMQILSSFETVPEGVDLKELFDNKIEGFIVNSNGDVITPLDDDGNEISAFDVKISDENKKIKAGIPDSMYLPVFAYKSTVNPGGYDAYIVPVYGNGLWDKIGGFIAIGSDFNTLKGSVFYHIGETPGLGARIASPEAEEGPTAFSLRFTGKRVFNESGELKSVSVLKGEKNLDIDEYHEIDGLSGASATTGGVNDMLLQYFGYYSKYLKGKQTESISEGEENEALDLRNSIQD